jgi:hypothetical protein
MVQVYPGDILPKLVATQPGKRMPVLCAVNRSFGWRIISENYEELVYNTTCVAIKCY